MNPEDIEIATQNFFGYLASELHLDLSADYEDLLPNESTGVFAPPTLSVDNRQDRKSGANIMYLALTYEMYIAKGVIANSEREAVGAIAGIVYNLPNIIAQYSQYASYTKGFYEIFWDKRNIQGIARSPLRNQNQQRNWIVDIPFGAVLYFVQRTSPQGIYI